MNGKVNWMNSEIKKLLYYGWAQDKQDSGGSVIRKRNLAFLGKMIGNSNITIHYHPKDTKIVRIACFLQALTGIELYADKILLKELKRTDATFIDGTIGGTFSSSTLRRTRVISFFHNVEYDYYCQEGLNRPGIISKLKYFLRKSEIFCYEKRICRHSDTIITLNQRDSERLRQLYGRNSDLILPSSMVDTYKKAEPEETPPYLLFVGSDFFGNTDGLFWFCEQCLPFIRIPLIVVGKGMEKYNNRYSPEQISFYGYVDDLSELYRNAAAVVLPIISGSGMKTKTCEAMMYGKVIFGTPESFEGYLLSSDCIVCKTDIEFIEAINTYLDKSGRRISTANRELFLKNYEDSVVAKKFYEYFTEK